MRNGRRNGGLLGLLRLAPVAVGGFVAALMIGGAATGALLTSSESTSEPPPSSSSEVTTTTPGDSLAAAADDPAPVISIAKTATPTAVVGGEIVYEVTVGNTGTAAAATVVIADVLPAGVKYVSTSDVEPASAECSTAAGSVQCTVPELAVGSVASLTITATAEEAGTLENTAGVVWQGVDTPTTATARTVVSPSGPAEETVDLALDKSAPASAIVGAEFPYTIRVDNVGTTDVENVEVADELPAGVDFAGSDDGCTESERLVTCPIGSLGEGELVTVAFDAVARTVGDTTNTATVHAAGDDNSENDSDEASTTIAAAPTGEKVLIYGPTNTNALRAAADRAGFGYDIKDGSDWASMTTEQFASYRAILIGDPFCGGVGTVDAAVANRSVWGAAVDGNVIIDGTDPVLHSRNDFTNAAVAFASAASDRTGAYISLSCYYHDTAAHTPVPLLEPFGTFTTTGVGCYNNVHIVADHPALAGINDAYLSGWGCSVHEAFDAWPTSFAVLAIAQDIGSAYTATDGTVGTPYIVARGEGLRVISNVEVTTVSEPTATGTTRMVTATVKEDGVPQAGKLVTFRVIEGPHVGTQATATTDTSGVATFAYTGTSTGTDAIEASYVDAAGRTQTSNRLFAAWTPGTTTTPPPAGGGGGGGGGGGTTTTTTTSTPAPLPPLPPPTDPQDLNARVVMGLVLLNGRPFEGTATIEVGDVVDTTRGTLELRSATGTLLVYDGAFRYSLDGGVAQFELVGGDFTICEATRRAAGRAADERPVRRLWGKGSGSFKTKARYSSATVRGTTWLTEDRCDGSLTRSDEGTVEVYDYSLRRILLVARGQQYLAQAPPPPTPGRFVGDPSGTVLVNGRPVTQDTQIRNGDTIDVRNGRLVLRTTSGEAAFYSGRFVVTQANSRTAYTVLRLVNGNFSVCSSRALAAGTAKPKPRKAKKKKNTTVVRSLWGDGKGKFRTQARFSSATVRGTRWLTADRCDGSLTRVAVGVVEVSDFTRRRTVLVRAGGEYVAPAPG